MLQTNVRYIHVNELISKFPDDERGNIDFQSALSALECIWPLLYKVSQDCPPNLSLYFLFSIYSAFYLISFSLVADDL